MKKLVITLIIIVCSFSSKAQESKIIGSWLLTQVETAGEIENTCIVTEYTKDGKMIMMGMEFATWDYNKKSNEIEMKSDFDKDFNGNGKILNLTDKELVIEKEGVKATYQKLDSKEEITTANINSGLVGMWEFKEVPHSNAKSFVSFIAPDEFIIIQKEEGMEATLKGKWIFDKKDRSLIMIGLRGEDTFNGKNKVIIIDDEVLELENKGEIFKGTKKVENSKKIERLTFSQEDFFTEDGNFKYESDVEKSPWYQLSTYGFRNTYAAINQVKYNYNTQIGETQTFESKTLTADVSVNFEENEIALVFDYIFNGYDRYNLLEDYNLPNNKYNSYNDLFPYEDLSFRVTGAEKISTPAGSFDCTVIEAIGSSEEKIKLWMIDDMPGIYAKIIQDKPGRFGYYQMYEIKEIIKKCKT